MELKDIGMKTKLVSIKDILLLIGCHCQTYQRSHKMPEDSEEDTWIDIGYRQNTPEQNYRLRTVRLQDVKDRTMAEIHKMLEDTDDEE